MKQQRKGELEHGAKETKEKAISDLESFDQITFSWNLKK